MANAVAVTGLHPGPSRGHGVNEGCGEGGFAAVAREQQHVSIQRPPSTPGGAAVRTSKAASYAASMSPTNRAVCEPLLMRKTLLKLALRAPGRYS